MKFGARFLGIDCTSRDLIEYGKLAERCGFDYCWYPHDTFMRNSWVLLSALSMETSTIKLATVGTNPYTTDPSEIATYLATLHELSCGRAVLGLGLHTTKMLSWIGIDAKEPQAVIRESFERIRNCFPGRGKASPRANRTAKFRWGDQAYLRFLSPETPPPIYIAGFGKSLNELSGKIADGSLPMVTPPESASYMVRLIMGGYRSAGRKNSIDIAGCAWISLAIDRNDQKLAEERLKPVIAYFGPYLEEAALQTIDLHRSDFSPIRGEVERGRLDLAKELVSSEMLRLGITGPLSECIERIARLAGDGITQVSLGGPWGPNVSESLRLVGREIIPVLKQE